MDEHPSHEDKVVGASGFDGNISGEHGTGPAGSGAASGSSLMVRFSVGKATTDMPPQEMTLDRSSTVQQWLVAITTKARLSGDHWHLSRTNRRGEAGDILDDLDATLDQCHILNGHLLLVQEGQLSPKPRRYNTRSRDSGKASSPPINYSRHRGNLSTSSGSSTQSLGISHSPNLSHSYASSYSNESFGSSSPGAQRLYPDLSELDSTLPNVSAVDTPNTSTNNWKHVEEWLRDPIGVCGLCFFLMLILAYFLFSPAIQSTDSEPDASSKTILREQALSDFKSKMEQMTSKFPKQTHRFWTILRSSSVRTIQETDPIHPTVVMVIGGPNSLPTLSCLAHKFAELFSSAFEFESTPGSVVQYDVNMSQNQNPDSIKEDIDDRLGAQGFQQNSHAAVIHQLDNIPPEAAMMFHGYCDNDNAPYKDVAIVFTMSLDVEVSEANGDQQVERHLQHNWGDMIGADQLPALLSRIANNVAVAVAETPDTLQLAGCPV